MSGRFNPAQGEPWQIMYVNLFNVLVRSRACYPLRLPFKEVVTPCLPELDEKDWKVRNLLRCVNYRTYVNFELEDGSIFHMVCMADETHPNPIVGEQGIKIPTSHPHYEALSKWHTQAEMHEEFITDARIYLNRTLKVLKHPQWVEKHWPAIVPYVGKLPSTMVKGMREPIERQVHRDYPLEDKIQNALTAAALISRDHESTAWVGPYTRREV